MAMRWFVQPDSIVRKIWGKSDVILFIFAGSAAEFALNKAVDWLFYTGRLPADPLGRLFSTVTYARKIVFSDEEKALEVIDRMATIHQAVEGSRGYAIPDWAYRDVLYMLIDYSIRSFELLNRKLSDAEKADVFEVFSRVGKRMGVKELPENFSAWQVDRQKHLVADLEHSELTTRLFYQYKIHLGWIRYNILLAGQSRIVPPTVLDLLRLRRSLFLWMLLPLYKLAVSLGLEWFFKSMILPDKYIDQIKDLDIHPE
jgi:uncharacterized protein (DUF2236 family)